MDRTERVRELRDRYEDALDQAEKLRAEYHREVLKLHRSGMSLREIADQLGISHQRVHQIVGVAEPQKKKWSRATGGVAVAALLLASGFGLSMVVRDGVGPVTRATSAARSSTPPAPSCTVTGSSPNGSSGRVARSGSSFRPMVVSSSIARLPRACKGEALLLDPVTGRVIAHLRFARGTGSLTFVWASGT